MDPGIGDQHFPVGSPIFSADGRSLGEVAGVDSGHVRVQAGDTRVYWLPLHAIEAVGSNRLTLAFAAHELEAYRESSPPP